MALKRANWDPWEEGEGGYDDDETDGASQENRKVCVFEFGNLHNVAISARNLTTTFSAPSPPPLLRSFYFRPFLKRKQEKKSCFPVQLTPRFS